MIAIVPAKASSTRVPNKNYRPFYGELSLVDLLLEKLCRVFPGGRIYLSCEDPDKKDFSDRWGVQFLQRETRLCDNATPFPKFLRGICDQVPSDDDVMWCEAIDPLFDGHARLIDRWDALYDPPACFGSVCRPDSMTVIYPMRQYVLTSGYHPLGFGFGHEHVPSQQLPTLYRLNFTCAILTRESIQRVGYPVGERPAWYKATNPFIDIDTEEDFEIAQAVYAHLMEKRK
jgi:N-acylneuraminate cytidylyltransferase